MKKVTPPAPPTLAVVDRVEGDTVVLELLEAKGGSVQRARSTFPSTLAEGDVVDLATGRVDDAETARLKASVKALQDALLQRSPNKPGGFDL